jgi:hypothetical protein
MGKYSTLQTKVLSVFGTAEWQAENVTTIPNDYSPPTEAEEYIRVSVIPSGEGLNLNSLSGICIIEIYTAFGFGPTKANAIADKLDKYLLGKSLGIDDTVVQFGNSSLSPKGQDKDNSTLTCQHYSIPFNLYGVF